MHSLNCIFLREHESVQVRKSFSTGFTLIELSIVLVIIGLVVGGVLVGQDLYKKALLRALVSDVEKIKTAIGTFRGSYNCLPGDCINATSYGMANNGNGDGIFGPATGYIWVGSSNISEVQWFWDQLGNRGLLPPPNYSGVNGGYGSVSRINNCAWYVGFSSRTNTTAYPAGTLAAMGNVISLRSKATIWANGCLTPLDGLWLDLKYDDGFPLSGIIQAIGEQTNDLFIDNDPMYPASAGQPACVNSPWSSSVYSYLPTSASTSTGTYCDFIFRLGF